MEPTEPLPPPTAARVAINAEVDVVSAMRLARDVAGRAGFSGGDQTALAAAVAEVARNILVHARSGAVAIRHEELGDRDCVIVVAVDAGPGIADIARAMSEGFSTAGRPGLGLATARRLSDEFEIRSAPGAGTTVTLGKWRRVRPRARDVVALDYAVRSPGPGTAGRAATVLAVPGGELVAVVRALGTAPEAEALADVALAAVRHHAHVPVAELVAHVHEALRGTPGAVLGLGRLDAGSRLLSWVAVGQFTAALLVAGDGSRTGVEPLPVRRGIVGLEVPVLEPTTLAVHTGDALVLSTSTGGADLAALDRAASPRRLVRDVRAAAGGTDDALVLAARIVWPGP